MHVSKAHHRIWLKNCLPSFEPWPCRHLATPPAATSTPIGHALRRSLFLLSFPRRLRATATCLTFPHLWTAVVTAMLPDGYCQIFRSYVFGPLGFCGQFHKIRYAAKRQLLLSRSRILTSFLWEIGFSKKAMTRKRQLLSNYIRLRIRLRGKQQLALSGVPDLMELAAEARWAKHILSKNLAIAIWQPWPSLLEL